MEVSVDLVKSLRERSGAGVMDCKRALEEAKGELDKAEELLKTAGLAAVAKRVSRETREGIVEAYVHSGSRIGVLIEVDCETDFVARTNEMKVLAHDLAMQVAAMSPTCVTEADMDPLEPRPSEEICLLQQTFIKDPSRRVQEVVEEVIAKVGENIRVSRFARFALGE